MGCVVVHQQKLGIIFRGRSATFEMLHIDHNIHCLHPARLDRQPHCTGRSIIHENGFYVLAWKQKKWWNGLTRSTYAVIGTKSKLAAAQRRGVGGLHFTNLSAARIFPQLTSSTTFFFPWWTFIRWLSTRGVCFETFLCVCWCVCVSVHLCCARFALPLYCARERILYCNFLDRLLFVIGDIILLLIIL